jgi:putative aldouronate transport system substrate-binding protein
MRFTIRLILTGVLLLLICGGLTWARGGTPQPVGAEEPVELKLFFEGSMSGASLNEGVQDDPLSKYIEEQTGVRLYIIGITTTEVFQTYLASGEIPDLTFCSEAKLYDQIIKGGLALKLDDLVDKHGKDLMANAGQKVKFSRNNYSAGTGDLYMIPATSGPAYISDCHIFGLNVRWDLYKRMGYPELKTYTDVLPLLKKMQEMEPVNENGQKVYGISFNSDWDAKDALYTTLLMPLYGWQNPESDWHGEIDVPSGNAVHSQFEPDSWMFKGAEFLWQANQMGLLDPDSVTQTFASYSEKMKAGRVLFSFVHWDTGSYRTAMATGGHPDRGHMPIYPKDSTEMWFWGAQPNGLLGGWFISSKCEAPDKAMTFINWLNSYDGAMAIFSGVQGDTWIIKDGKPWLKDETIKEMDADPEFNLKHGIIKYYNASGLNEWTVHPEYGVMLASGSWPTTKERTYPELYKDYCSHYGVDMPYEMYEKNFRTTYYDSDIYLTYMQPMPDDIKAIAQKLSEMVKTEIYKMIFARDAAERDAVKARIINQAKALGSDKEWTWVLAERDAAKKRYNEANQ